MANPYLSKFITELATIYGREISPVAQKMLNPQSEFYRAIYNLGVLISKYKQISLKASAEDYLISLAGNLDKNGLVKIADHIDCFIETKNPVHLICLADDLDRAGLTKEADEIDEIVKMAEEPIINRQNISLSSRHCKDHVGVSLRRITDILYQCPVDGKKYDMIYGYTNYKGEVVPGGAISQQSQCDNNFITPGYNWSSKLSDWGPK